MEKKKLMSFRKDKFCRKKEDSLKISLERGTLPKRNGKGKKVSFIRDN